MNQGKKYDSKKSRVDLIPYEALDQIGQVLLFGANKYDEHNWKKGIPYSKLIASALRHLGKFNAGINLDEESNLNHLAHAATNILMLIWMQQHRPDLDNRYKGEPACQTNEKKETQKNTIAESSEHLKNACANSPGISPEQRNAWLDVNHLRWCHQQANNQQNIMKSPKVITALDALRES